MGAKADKCQWLQTGTSVSARRAIIPTDNIRPLSSSWGYGTSGELGLVAPHHRNVIDGTALSLHCVALIELLTSDWDEGMGKHFPKSRVELG
jgi:hypothetical protein